MTYEDDPTRPLDNRDPYPGTERIGGFRLKRVIASGAMGTVYEALQDHPRRTVAIKILKRGVASPSAMRRFEFEAQLLARLHHPGVAEIYEAGTYEGDDGPVPYFAMEYVPRASPITSYADSRNLDIRSRLQLFAKVCDAVHHGHQKGIVHRDLKPANIIVGANGSPKIIDFGVARATDSDLALATLQTQVGQLVGTLQYMSPEQVEADPHDIDIRADVYSLGVILYELLLGRPPYEVSEVSTLEALRRIREIAPNRLGSADRHLAGDVETIVHKALEKDRERRYQSAGEMAADIRRNLDRQPIAARPPTLVYTLRVFTRRNRILVGAVATVFAVLVAGVATSTTLYLRAEKARVEAERQSARTLNAIGFVEDMVESANPTCRGEEVKVGDLLDEYSKSVGEAFPDDPEIEAAIRTSIGRCYGFLDDYETGGQAKRYQEQARGHFEKAIELQTRASGPEHDDVLDARVDYAALLWNQGRIADAEVICREVLEICRNTRGENDDSTIEQLTNIAILLRDQERYDEAEKYARDALAKYRELYGDEYTETLRSTSTLSTILYDRGNFAAAEELDRAVYTTRLRTSGADHDRTASARRRLAQTLLAQDKLEEAKAVFGDVKIPADLGVERWIQGGLPPEPKPLTIYFAMESWCPFCARAAPKIELLYKKYMVDGLSVIGLTKLTQSTSDEKMREFLKNFGVTFPVAKLADDFSGDLYTGSVPRAVITEGSTVVWQGHPNNIPESIFGNL